MEPGQEAVALSSIFVTGASGFIGRRLCLELAARGLPVVAVARRQLDLPPGLRQCRVADYADLKLPADCGVIHLAEAAIADGGVGGLRAQSLRVLEPLLAQQPKHLIYASSALVFRADRQQPRRIDEIPDGEGAYAEAKQACEARVLRSGYCVVRLGNVFGPAMQNRIVLHDIIDQLGQSGPMRLRNGLSARDFVSVAAVVRGFAELARRRLAGVFHLSSGHAISVEILARLCMKVAGEAERPVLSAIPQASWLALDPSEAARRIGWRPDSDISPALAEMIEATR